MNPTSQIKIPNGTVLDLKDAGARQSISDLDVRVTALENAPAAGSNKFIKFYGANLMALFKDYLIYPDILYLVDDHENAVGRLLYPRTDLLTWTDSHSKSGLTIQSGIHSLNVGDLSSDTDLHPLTFAQNYPNYLYQFDSLSNALDLVNSYLLTEERDINYASLLFSSAPIYTSNPAMSGKFLYSSDVNHNDESISIQYIHRYRMKGIPVYQEIADPENQIYIKSTTDSSSGLNIITKNALAITDVKLYNTNTNIFENCTLYNNLDYNPVNEDEFIIHNNGYAPNIYKFTFANNSNTYWTIITSNYKLHA